ncbi:MAG: DUF456 family protein [Elusimicrobiota bacterium]
MNILYTVLISLFALAAVVLSSAGFSGAILLWLGIFILSAVQGFEVISLTWIIIFLAAAAAGEIIEFAGGMIGARRAGGSSGAVKGALFGGMAGAVVFSSLIGIPGFFVGVLTGTFAGAFIVEYVSGRDFYSSSKAGAGALAARVISSGIKVLVILFISSIAVAKHMGVF